MATVGRAREVERLLDSLGAQTHRDFELVAVDQGSDNRISTLLASYGKQFPVLHLKSGPGVSSARNIGLEHVSGEVVGFPDDDCWYPPHLLEQIVRAFREHDGVDGVGGRVADERETFDARFDPSPGLVSIPNVWLRTAIVCLFVRRHVVDKVGKFDESLGPNSGTIWGGGEDIDYALRVVKAGFKVHYDPNLRAFHPNPLRHGYQKMSGRAYAYGAGIGRVWSKHDYPIRLVVYHLSRPLGGAILSCVTGRREKAGYHWSAFRGRLRGWLSK